MKKLMLLLLLVSQSAICMERKSADDKASMRRKLSITMRVAKAKSDTHLTASSKSKDTDIDPDDYALKDATTFFGQSEKERKAWNVVELGTALSLAFERKKQRIVQLEADIIALQSSIKAKDKLFEELLKQFDDAAKEDDGSGQDAKKKITRTVAYGRETLRRMKKTTNNNANAEPEADGIPRDGSLTGISDITGVNAQE